MLFVLWITTIILFGFTWAIYCGYTLNKSFESVKSVDHTYANITIRSITAILIIITTCFAWPTFYYTFEAITREFMK